MFNFLLKDCHNLENKWTHFVKPDEGFERELSDVSISSQVQHNIFFPFCSPWRCFRQYDPFMTLWLCFLSYVSGVESFPCLAAQFFRSREPEAQRGWRRAKQTPGGDRSYQQIHCIRPVARSVLLQGQGSWDSSCASRVRLGNRLCQARDEQCQWWSEFFWKWTNSRTRGKSRRSGRQSTASRRSVGVKSLCGIFFFNDWFNCGMQPMYTVDIVCVCACVPESSFFIMLSSVA